MCNRADYRERERKGEGRSPILGCGGRLPAMVPSNKKALILLIPLLLRFVETYARLRPLRLHSLHPSPSLLIVAVDIDSLIGRIREKGVYDSKRYEISYTKMEVPAT